MLISHRHKFIYLKTTRTAGTSVEIYFERFCADPAAPLPERHFRPAQVSEWGVVGFRGEYPQGQTWYHHMPASRVRTLVGRRVWKDYFKFCVIRNPFDKVVSWFWARLEDDDRERLHGAAFSVVQRAFRSWVRRGDFPIDRQVFLIDDEPVVDYFIRYERLEEGLRRVCRKLQLPWDPGRLGRYKTDMRIRGEHFSAYYDARTESAVRRDFDWELRYFGYDINRSDRSAARRPRRA